MKRKAIFLSILAIVGISIIFLIRYLSGRSPKQGVLKITSTPSASVFLDNKHVGMTPYEDKVPAGDITIKVIPESTVASISSWQGKVTVAPNTLTYINRDLTESELTSSGEVLWLEKINSKVSEIDIVSNPDGASVFLDDALKGVAPLNMPEVSAADHALTVTSPGFLSKTLKIKTTAGYKVKVAVQLALNPGTTPVPTPSVVVEATPSASPTPMTTISPATTPVSTPASTPIKTATPTITPKITPKATPTDPAKPFVVIKETGTGFLRVRKEPTTQSEELTRVNPGEKYSIQDSKTVGGVTWYQIKYDGNNLGWVSGQYVEKVE